MRCFILKIYIDNTSGDEGTIVLGEEARALVLLPMKNTHLGESEIRTFLYPGYKAYKLW